MNSSIFDRIYADKPDVAGSYFELLTEQNGLPAKPFDPLEELRRLRRRLAARMQQADFRDEVSEIKSALESEPVSLEAVINRLNSMQKTLTILHRSRMRAESQRSGIFRSQRRMESKKRMPAVSIPHMDTPQGGILETLNVALTGLGIVGIVFGILNFYHGWEGNLSLGSLVCTSGAAIVAIGIGGRCLAARYTPS